MSDEADQAPTEAENTDPKIEETLPEPPAPDEENPKEDTEQTGEEAKDVPEGEEEAETQEKKDDSPAVSKSDIEADESQLEAGDKHQKPGDKKKKKGAAGGDKASKKKEKAKKDSESGDKPKKKNKKKQLDESKSAADSEEELEKPALAEPAETASDTATKKKSASPKSVEKGEKKRKSKKGATKSAEEVKVTKEKKSTKKEPKKKKEKKVKKLPSTTRSQEEVTEDSPGEKKQKKKDKKGKGKKTTVRKEASGRLKKGVSISEGRLHKDKKSQLSFHQLMGRLSMHATEMEEIRRHSLMLRSSSVWTLSDSTSSEESEDADDVEAQRRRSTVVMEKPKKGKKGKKGKKEKKEKKKEPVEGETEDKKEKKKGKGKKREHKEEPEAAIEPQEDVLAEITRMKYLADLAASGEESEEASEVAPKKEKKKKKKEKKEGPKKKLSKKEKARLAAEQAEKAKVSAEEAAAKAAELERIRLAEERKAAIEKEARETFEQQLRMEQLESGCEHFRALVADIRGRRGAARAQAEWEFYVGCGRLPNPGKCDQMNTFLHLWESTIEGTSMEEAARKTEDVLELLGELDGLIDAAEGKGSDKVDNWKWVRLLFRQQQAKSLDVATYRLLRNIEKNLHRIDIPTADYKYQDDNIALCLWLRIQLPTPLPNPRRPPKPRIEVEFPEMKLEVQFPPTIDGEKMAVRALYVKYDHLSDLSETYDKPPIPQQYDMDLYTAMKREWRGKMLYKYKNRAQATAQQEETAEGEEGEETEEERDEFEDEEKEIPVVPYRKLEPTASEYVIGHEDELYGETRISLIKTVPDDVINLRKYSIIGGVYFLNLVHQPPQPQDFVTLEMNLTPLYLPKQLELVNLYLDYDPPIPPEPNVRRPPEEIEEEMKKHEEELERLVLVTLTWPEHVIFLELPMVCFWDDEQRVWTKREVHDLKHNEEKGQLSFRTRKGAIFGLAVYRYANLPYQAWEMRPEANGTISFQITAAILMVEFNVKGGLIALSQLQNSPNNALQDIIGVYYELPKLIRVLQSAGVDVFPAFDAFCYIETTCEKHWPMERHLYFNMAQLGMRDYNPEKTKQKNHLMLHVTPLKALYVDCTEVSQSFNEEGVEGMKFYPDLFHLMKGTCSMAIKDKLGKASKELVFACYELLVATRVVSFS